MQPQAPARCDVAVGDRGRSCASPTAHALERTVSLADLITGASWSRRVVRQTVQCDFGIRKMRRRWALRKALKVVKRRQGVWEALNAQPDHPERLIRCDFWLLCSERGNRRVNHSVSGYQERFCGRSELALSHRSQCGRLELEPLARWCGTDCLSHQGGTPARPTSRGA